MAGRKPIGDKPLTQKELDERWVIVQLRLTPDLAEELDNLRRVEADIPSRGEMARRAVKHLVDARKAEMSKSKK